MLYNEELAAASRRQRHPVVPNAHTMSCINGCNKLSITARPAVEKKADTTPPKETFLAGGVELIPPNWSAWLEQ
jgi:hypothetical protein